MRTDENILTNIANSSSPAVKKGFLWKWGDKKKELLRRWFVLKCNMLFYFEKINDKKPLGVIVLEGVTIKTATGSGSYCIEITPEDGQSRTYILETSSKTDMELWTSVLKSSSYYLVRQQYEELKTRYEKAKEDNRKKEKQEVNRFGEIIAAKTIVTKL